jgi:CDP-diglyceride synthetase
MGTTSFLLLVFHLICFSAIGVLISLQFAHYFEYKLKRISKYSYPRYFVIIFLIVFLGWVLEVTGGLHKQHWVVNLLYFVCVIMGVYLTVKILFKKKGLSFSDL